MKIRGDRYRSPRESQHSKGLPRYCERIEHTQTVDTSEIDELQKVLVVFLCWNTIPIHEFLIFIQYTWCQATNYSQNDSYWNSPNDSMYAIFTYIWLKFMVKVGKYSMEHLGPINICPTHHGNLVGRLRVGTP